MLKNEGDLEKQNKRKQNDKNQNKKTDVWKKNRNIC